MDQIFSKPQKRSSLHGKSLLQLMIINVDVSQVQLYFLMFYYSHSIVHRKHNSPCGFLIENRDAYSIEVTVLPDLYNEFVSQQFLLKDCSLFHLVKIADKLIVLSRNSYLQFQALISR